MNKFIFHIPPDICNQMNSSIPQIKRPFYAKESSNNGEESDAHKYGLPPHGGLGLGLERLTQKIIGLDNVKGGFLLPKILEITP